LANSGILTETTKLTSHPSVKDALSQFDYSEESVVVSGNIITSRGAGTSIDFALKIIEILKDRETAMKIANDIVYTKSGGKNG
jgi:transcriptional regulator GlxA family with amidase domain